MARKTKEEAEKTRIQILKSALEIFYKKGYSQTTRNDIATHAGVTRGAVYWHFEDKIDLFMKMSEYIHVAHNMNVNHSELPIDSINTLKTYLGHFCNILTTSEDYRKYMYTVYNMVEYTEELKPVIDRDRKHFIECFEWLKEGLKNIAENNELKPNTDPEQLAITIISMSMGLIEMDLINYSGITKKFSANKIMNDFIDSQSC